MSEEEKEKESGEISRRQFLAGAGLVVAGGAIGAGIAYPLLPQEEVEVPKFVCPFDGQEFDSLNALTDHMEAAHPGEVEVITKFVCPFDGQEFVSLAALQSHVDAEHPGEVEVITKYTCPYDGQEFVSLAALQSHVDAEHPAEVVEDIPGAVTLTVNGNPYLVKVKPNWSLVFVLREKLGLTGTKIGCDRGTCGTCTVIVDGRSVYSCMVLAIESEGKDILTVEGLSDGITLHPVQQAFVDNDAVQCGYCIPGFLMSAKALLEKNPSPTRDEVREALSGHFCPCGHTKKIVDAVL